MYDQQRFLQGMPFYMAYPMQNIYQTEMEYEQDMERMKQLYPKEAQEIQRLVEDECDKLEYEGSMMFDEFPDRMMLQMVGDKIYDKLAPDMKESSSQEAQGLKEAYRYEGQQPPVEGRSYYEASEPAVTEADFQAQGGPTCRPGKPCQRPDRPPHGNRPSHGHRPPRDRRLEDLIQVLLYNEIYQRRCRHKRCRHWW